MSTAFQRLGVTHNHLKAKDIMASASNFYSVVAGVGAGTGNPSSVCQSATANSGLKDVPWLSSSQSLTQ